MYGTFSVWIGRKLNKKTDIRAEQVWEVLKHDGLAWEVLKVDAFYKKNFVQNYGIGTGGYRILICDAVWNLTAV